VFLVPGFPFGHKSVEEQMENTGDGRTERIAAGLEKSFDDCNSLKDDWMADAFKDRGLFRDLTNLLKASAQLAGMISRFEAMTGPSRENRGSIPQ
jgi:hypothetical protein